MANDWNENIIKEFRENGGNVASFGNQPLLLLHTVGAKSGEGRLHPVAYLAGNDVLYVFASFAGRPENPAWFHNLKANPQVKIEVGAETYAATATEITGTDRDEIYARQVAHNPGFGDYERKTTRVIPVIALTRA